MSRCSIAVIILTLNEELSLPIALGSVSGWAEEIFVVDSFSTDRTRDIARERGALVFEQEFESFAAQRNWALQTLPIRSDWILFLDADEWVPADLRAEIDKALSLAPDEVVGFYTKMRFIFLGRPLRYGDLYKALIRLFRRGKGQYIQTGGFREKLAISGVVRSLQHAIVHDDRKLLTDWIVDQSTRILVDARERTEKARISDSGEARFDTQTVEGGNSRWLRDSVLLKLPGPVRPFAQFFYRYVLRLGFLDGWPGFVYHFLLQFWYPLMVEATCADLRNKR